MINIKMIRKETKDEVLRDLGDTIRSTISEKLSRLFTYKRAEIRWKKFQEQTKNSSSPSSSPVANSPSLGSGSGSDNSGSLLALDRPSLEDSHRSPSPSGHPRRHSRTFTSFSIPTIDDFEMIRPISKVSLFPLFFFFHYFPSFLFFFELITSNRVHTERSSLEGRREPIISVPSKYFEKMKWFEKIRLGN